MSNERIDLTLYEGHTKGDPRDNPDSWRVVGDGFVMNGTHPQPRYIGYIRHSNFEPHIPAKREPLSEADANLIADGPLLLAELKRCYEELDFLKENVLTDDDYWIATCKPDGEGQCTLFIEGYEELMRLEKEGKVEIPEYSHGSDELLLEEGCECGITHEEWLESKN